MRRPRVGAGAAGRATSRRACRLLPLLPQVYGSVFMLEVEGLSTAETASCLDINGETVKTRLHRARALLRNHITARIGAGIRETFQFAGARCDRMVAGVM